MKKNEYFAKHFATCKFFLELQCLVDDLVDFLELSIFINVSLPLNILLNEVGRQHGHGKKHFVRYHLHLFFIKKTFTWWLKLMTCSYTCGEQMLDRK